VNWKRLRGILGVLLVFVFGVIVGGALAGGGIWREVGRIIVQGPDALVKQVANRLNDELKLDEDQRRMLAQITTDTQIKLRTIQSRNQPEVDHVLKDAADQIRVILSSEQREKFEKIIGRVQVKWRNPARKEQTGTPSVEMAKPEGPK
jgi:sensor histidine kinase YesM